MNLPTKFTNFRGMCRYACRHASSCWETQTGSNPETDKMDYTQYKFHQLGTILTEIDRTRTWVCLQIDQTKTVCPKNLTKISTEKNLYLLAQQRISSTGGCRLDPQVLPHLSLSLSLCYLKSTIQ